MFLTVQNTVENESGHMFRYCSKQLRTANVAIILVRNSSEMLRSYSADSVSRSNLIIGFLFFLCVFRLVTADVLVLGST